MQDLAAIDNQREVAEERREDLNNKCEEQDAAWAFGKKAGTGKLSLAAGLWQLVSL